LRINFPAKSKAFNLMVGVNMPLISFKTFFLTMEILHRKSCPYTSQQNGLAERKLRHLLETGLTLLATQAFPINFGLMPFSLPLTLSISYPL
jgi:hypothetical protein